MRRSSLAQPRIDYIVFGNPKGVRRLVKNEGYAAPSNLDDLLEVTKELIRDKGRKAVKELVKVHPDRKAILKIAGSKENDYCSYCSTYSYNPTDDYCGSCGHSNYNDEQSSFLKKLGLNQLETHYQRLLAKASTNPEDIKLGDEIQKAFDELNKRRSEGKNAKTEEDNSTPSIFKYKDELIIGSITLVVGILIGTSFPTVKTS